MAADDVAVDLELVQAVDASGSVDPDEWQLQLNGVAAAVRDPEVLTAIKSGAHGRIAVAVMAWADATLDKDETDWFLIDSSDSAEAFAKAVEHFPRRVEGGTGIGSALAAAVRLMLYNQYAGARQVVDVSGDGTETPSREEATILLPSGVAMADAYNVTVNGLAITNEVGDLDEYYRSNVATGPGHFVMKAKNYVDFRVAIREKLLREISPDIAEGPSASELALAGSDPSLR